VQTAISKKSHHIHFVRKVSQIFDKIVTKKIAETFCDHITAMKAGFKVGNFFSEKPRVATWRAR
jgi:hypothetical protein